MKQQYDLIVAGGGMSGVAAAVAAGRKGLKVLLVEQSSMLGGLGTSGLMTMIMASNYWFYGIGKEIIDGLIAEGKARLIDDYPVKDYRRIPFDAESMKLALDEIVLKSGAELMLYTKIIGVEQENGCLTRLVLAGPTGNFSVEGKIFVDATGDAMLAFYAGEPIELGDESGNTQAPTMTAYYAGVDFERYEEFLKTYEDGPAIPKVNMIHDLIPKAVEDGVVSVEDLHHPGIFRISPCFNVGVMNAGHVYGADCLSPEGLTDATVKGRRMAAEYLNFYRKYIPGFEKAYLTNTGSYLGLRETRRVVGKYVTTFEDKSTYRKFDDAIMRFDGGAVSDVHASSPDKKAYQNYYNLFSQREGLREDDYATLPYRSLLPQNTKNLLIAGRCVSADRKVQGQIRIMGYCFMMGEAAGLAAALAIAENKLPGEINVSKLQVELKRNGVETR
ncbi:MAG: FAD-dependent oxidoreductase [Lachnospiraceae bacterium]|nr:FAD-dependent oxidoreductase [Lachnospiraceae bacterium]